MPSTTVAAIITTTEGRETRVLLTRRNVPPFRGRWCLPGGHIDRDEPARDAVVREVAEETGLDFYPRFFSYFDEIIPERGIHAVVLAFAGPASGELVCNPAEVTEVGWFSAAEARSLDFAFHHGGILEAYFEANKRHRGRRGMNRGTRAQYST